MNDRKEDYITVEDKASGSWLVLRLCATSNDIVARCKSKFWAADIAVALNTVYGPGREDWLNNE